MTLPCLDDAAVAARLASLPAWHRDGLAIVRVVKLKGFARPLLLATRSATWPRRPAPSGLTIRHGSLSIRLTTHDAGGITDRDFALAARIDALIG